MQLTSQPVPEMLNGAARDSALGPYEGSALTRRTIDWKWLVLPAILLVVGTLGLLGIVELETSRRGDVDGSTLWLGVGIGLVGLAVALVRYLSQKRQAIHMYGNGFIVDNGRGGGTVLTYAGLLGYTHSDGKKAPVHYVRTEMQRTWTQLPPVRGIDEIGPAIMAKAAPPA